MLKAIKKKLRETLYSAEVRKKFHKSKVFSTKKIKPTAPWLHNFLFETLKRFAKRVVLRSLRSDEMSEGIDFSRFFQLGKGHKSKEPLISVIVPNFNHEPYLRERLESIYAQSYRNFEVILLDDKSSDASVEILEEYVQKYPQISQLIVNEVNSGGVFHQWKKGIDLAKGELIWIAESDDYCSLDFLEKLVGFFDHDGVMLAYAKTLFVQDEKEIWSIGEYLSDIDEDLWSGEFISCAHRVVNRAWGIKNIVPNASGAIFRNPKGMAILDDALWKKMRICGDWIFYLNVVRGGLVAYTPACTNYYRIHNSNTSVATYAKDIFYKEHEMVASTLCKLYKIDEKLLERQRDSLKGHWDRYMGERDDFLELYDIDRVKSFIAERKPNIMMVTFALAAGGGETLPIKIANMLSEFGYGVTMLSLQQDDENPQVRAMLKPHIPLIKIEDMQGLEAIAVGLGVEVVHSHHAWADLTLVSLLQDNDSIGMVISTHGMYEMMSEDEFRENFELLKERVDSIVYTADKNLVPFSRVGAESLMVKIGNALEACEIVPVERETLGISEDAFVLCLVSRAIPEKGWEEAILSVRRAREISNKEIELVLIGEGEEYSRLKSIVDDSFIHFCGFQSNIRDYFAMADLGFLPSRFEGESFPLVVIDSLYASRPVLASNIGEIYTMLHDGDICSGSVFDLENMQIPIEKVAQIIAKYASDEQFYQNSLSAIPKIMLKYDPSEMVRKYAEIYSKISTKRG